MDNRQLITIFVVGLLGLSVGYLVKPGIPTDYVETLNEINILESEHELLKNQYSSLLDNYTELETNFTSWKEIKNSDEELTIQIDRYNELMNNYDTLDKN